MAKENAHGLSMDSLISLCKRRGFIYPSSEIYGGLNGFFDYGPLGVELRKNIKDAWWQDMVQRREDILGLDSALILHPAVWKASGHLDNFTDPMVDCRESKQRFRADQLFFAPVLDKDHQVLGYVCLQESEAMEEEARKKAGKMAAKAGTSLNEAALVLKQLVDASPDEMAQIPSPVTGTPGALTPPRDFNLMFQTWVGAVRDENSAAYLRPETAQGIFINFKNFVCLS